MAKKSDDQQEESKELITNPTMQGVASVQKTMEQFLAAADVEAVFGDPVQHGETMTDRLTDEQLDALAEVGFDIEPFGGTSFRIRAVPEMLSQADPAQALVDILAEMADGAIPLARETHERIAITVCKRAAIKGGQVFAQDEEEGGRRDVGQAVDHRQRLAHGRFPRRMGEDHDGQ